MTPASEEWRPVVGFEDAYEVSDHGRARSLDRYVGNGTGTMHLLRGRLVAQTPEAQTGRPRANLRWRGRRRIVFVHTLVLEAFAGPRPEGLEACHGNGDCADNRLSNLRWDSRSENVLDRVRHGTHHHAKKTHCKRGHELRAPNLVKSKLARGQRQCRICFNEQQREQRRARLARLVVENP